MGNILQQSLACYRTRWIAAATQSIRAKCKMKTRAGSAPSRMFVDPREELHGGDQLQELFSTLSLLPSEQAEPLDPRSGRTPKRDL